MDEYETPFSLWALFEPLLFFVIALVVIGVLHWIGDGVKSLFSGGSKMQDHEGPAPGSQTSPAPAEAMAALRVINANLSRGLFPTTSGQVSLMDRRVVDLMYERNRGSSANFSPAVPDREYQPAVSRGDWHIAAIEQALFHGSYPFEPEERAVMDAMLHTYHSAGVDWRRIHSYATALDSTVPPIGAGTLWTDSGVAEPRSITAFLGASHPATR